MIPEVMQIVVPVVTAIVASIGTFLATSNTNNKDITLNDRKALSDDEKAFRQGLMDTLNGYKSNLDEARVEIRSLSEEVTQLHKINLDLTLENKRLQIKVDDLRTELHAFQGREG